MTSDERETEAVDVVDSEPRFVIRGQDALALVAIERYRVECEVRGLFGQRDQVQRAKQEIAGWQRRNPDRVKLPDHVHVPVSEVRGED